MNILTEERLSELTDRLSRTCRFPDHNGYRSVLEHLASHLKGSDKDKTIHDREPLNIDSESFIDE